MSSGLKIIPVQQGSHYGILGSLVRVPVQTLYSIALKGLECSLSSICS